MYEKPQYFTPDGYKRLSKNPYRDPETIRLIEALRKKKALLAAKPKISPLAPKGGISDEAARLIAGVLKGMLHNRGK